MVLILASASIARKRLLEQVGIPYLVMVSDIDESESKEGNIKDQVEKLAIQKARNIEKRISANQFMEPSSLEANCILGCDSLFEFEGKTFGKPFDQSEVLSRWERMSGKFGVLHTGHCFLFHSQHQDKITEDCTFNDAFYSVVQTIIYFKELSRSEIENYSQMEEPLKCAGGFALDGKAGKFIRRIDGCYSNVLGLSLPWLVDSLNKSGLSRLHLF